ncbi:MAG: hypothetical protein ABIV25_11805 [Paracoccaceae bacterium]
MTPLAFVNVMPVGGQTTTRQQFALHGQNVTRSQVCKTMNATKPVAATTSATGIAAALNPSPSAYKYRAGGQVPQ